MTGYMSLFRMMLKMIWGSIRLFVRIIYRLKLLDRGIINLRTSRSTAIHKKAAKTNQRTFKQHLMQMKSKTTHKSFSGKVHRNLTRTNNKNPKPITPPYKTKTNPLTRAPASPTTLTARNSPNS